MSEQKKLARGRPHSIYISDRGWDKARCMQRCRGNHSISAIVEEAVHLMFAGDPLVAGHRLHDFEDDDAALPPEEP